jgi:hypothetical protein
MLSMIPITPMGRSSGNRMSSVGAKKRKAYMEKVVLQHETPINPLALQEAFENCRTLSSISRLQII